MLSELKAAHIQRKRHSSQKHDDSNANGFKTARIDAMLANSLGKEMNDLDAYIAVYYIASLSYLNGINRSPLEFGYKIAWFPSPLRTHGLGMFVNFWVV